MAGVLEKLGKSVRIVNGQATPPNLKFIDPQNRIEAVGVNVQAAELLAQDFEVMMVLDTSAWAQLGPMADVVPQPRGQRRSFWITTRAATISGRGFPRHRSGSDGPAGGGGGGETERCDYAASWRGRYFARSQLTPVGFGFHRQRAIRFDSATAGRRGSETSALYHDLYENNTLAQTKLIGRILAQRRVGIGWQTGLHFGHAGRFSGHRRTADRY